jgi:hypothetical protein
MTKTKASALSALFFFVLLPLYSGCAGGCGEDTSGKPGAENGANGTAGGVSSHGGGQGVGIGSRYDSASNKSTDTALGQVAEVSDQASRAKSSSYALGPDEFRERVLNGGATQFITVVAPGCADCDVMRPVLATLQPQFGSRYEFHEFDGMAVGASGLLPPKLSLEPLPAFVMYKNGKPTSWLQGLPFPREAGEPLETYQKRLQRWFHDALTQKNLNFARTIRPAAKKT